MDKNTKIENENQDETFADLYHLRDLDDDDDIKIEADRLGLTFIFLDCQEEMRAEQANRLMSSAWTLWMQPVYGDVHRVAYYADGRTEARGFATRGKILELLRASKSAKAARSKFRTLRDTPPDPESHRVAIATRAAESGKEQVIRTWMTSECTRNARECSMDQATETVLPNGKTRITYICTH